MMRQNSNIYACPRTSIVVFYRLEQAAFYAKRPLNELPRRCAPITRLIAPPGLERASAAVRFLFAGERMCVGTSHRVGLVSEISEVSGFSLSIHARAGFVIWRRGGLGWWMERGFSLTSPT
jgi:hypothetical protein